MMRFCKTHFTILLILTFLLSGCSRKSPVESIVDNQINHFTSVLEMTRENFEQTIEVQFLENELDSCIVVLDSVKQTYYSEIDGCEAKTNYWRLATLFLGIMILGAILVRFRKWFKII